MEIGKKDILLKYYADHGFIFEIEADLLRKRKYIEYASPEHTFEETNHTVSLKFVSISKDFYESSVDSSVKHGLLFLAKYDNEIDKNLLLHKIVCSIAEKPEMGVIRIYADCVNNELVHHKFFCLEELAKGIDAKSNVLKMHFDIICYKECKPENVSGSRSNNEVAVVSGISSESSDCTIVLECAGKEFKTHKSTLANGSSLFAEILLKNHCKNKQWVERISIKNEIKSEVFEYMLAFIYTGKADLKLLEDNFFYDLYSLVVKYNIKRLKNLCEKHLKYIYDRDNGEHL